MGKRSRLSLRAEELWSYLTGLAPVGHTVEVPIAQARGDLRLGGEWVYYKYINQLISLGHIRRIACGSGGSTGVLVVQRRLEDIPTGTVKSRINRGREMFHRVLGDQISD